MKNFPAPGWLSPGRDMSSLARKIVIFFFILLILPGCRGLFREKQDDIIIQFSGVNEDTWGIITALIEESGVLNSPYKLVYRGTDEEVSLGQPQEMEKVEIVKTSPESGQKVVIRGVSYPQYQGNEDVFTLVLASSESAFLPEIDMYFIDLYWFSNFRRDWLEPYPPEIAHRLRPELLSTVLLPPSGKKRDETNIEEEEVYAIPSSVKGNFLFYRKDLLNGYSLPRSWNELEALCKAILEKKSGHNAPKYGLLYDWQYVHNDYYPFAWGNGAEMTADGITSEESVSALTGFYDLVRKLSPDAHKIKEEEQEKPVHELYEEGLSIFMINWNNRFEKMRKAREERLGKKVTLKEISSQFGIIPIPHTISEKSFSNFGSWGWIVAKQELKSDYHEVDETDAETVSARKEAIFKFLDYLSSEQAQIWIMYRFGDLPSMKIKDSENILKVADTAVKETYEILESSRVVFKARPRNKAVNRMIEAMLHDMLQKDFASQEELTAFARQKLERIRRDMTIISE